MILILAPVDDRAAGRIDAVLAGRGVTTVRFDPARFPAQARVSLTCSGGVLETGGVRHDLAGVRAIWQRPSGASAAPEEITRAMTRRFVEYECGHFIEDVWQTLACRWMPAPEAIVRRAGARLFQIKAAGGVGMDVPPTLITNDPGEVEEFRREHGGRVICAAEAAPYCPTIYQADVPRRDEARAIVVGTQVLADHRLPPDVERRCVALSATLGLSFAVIDLIVTPDGRYVLGSLDPNGHWLEIQERTGLPIAETICDYLMEYHAART